MLPPCIRITSVQYRGGVQYRGRVQYRRGYHNACGGYLEYCGGCSVPWGYHDKCGGIYKRVLHDVILLATYVRKRNPFHVTEDMLHATISGCNFRNDFKSTLKSRAVTCNVLKRISALALQKDRTELCS